MPFRGKIKLQPLSSGLGWIAAKLTGVDKERIASLESLGDSILENRLSSFGYAYVEGSWSPDDILSELTRMANRLVYLNRMVPRVAESAIYRRAVAKRCKIQPSDGEVARRDIEFHYDMPVDFFCHFLDESLTYSSGIFMSSETTLEDAQECKLDRAISELHLGPGCRVIEIGSGWGSLSLKLASEGHRVNSLTLSSSQYHYCRDQSRQRGFEDFFVPVISDYREVEGSQSYDAAVSIEMIEAVGSGGIGEYFLTVAKLLKPGSRFVVQYIYMSPLQYSYTPASTWTNSEVFPGGEILTDALVASAADAVGFREWSSLELGEDYARTLEHWAARFNTNRSKLLDLGYSERVLRVWEYYLALSCAGFRSGLLGCKQVTYVLS